MSNISPIKTFIETDLDTTVNRLASQIGYSTQRIDNWINRNKHPSSLPFEFYLLIYEKYQLPPMKVYLKLIWYMVENTPNDFFVKCLEEENIDFLKIVKKDNKVELKCLNEKGKVIIGYRLEESKGSSFSNQTENLLQSEVFFDNEKDEEAYKRWLNGVKRANERYKKNYYSLA